MEKLKNSLITAGIIIFFVVFPWLFFVFIGAFIKMIKGYYQVELKNVEKKNEYSN